MGVAHGRGVGVDAVDRDVVDLEHDRVAGAQAGGDQVLDDLLLPVDRDRVADEVEEVDAVTAAPEGELDAAVGKALAVEALGEAELAEQLDARVLEHAGADALLDVGAVAVLEHDAVDARGLEQVGEGEPGRPGADDRDRRVGRGGHAVDPAGAIVACRRRRTSSSSGVGGASSSTSSATARSQPVDRLTSSTVAPGCSAVSVSSQVAGSGRNSGEVGDDDLRATATQPPLLAASRSGAEPDGGDEVDAVDERPRRVAQHHDDLAARRRDLGGAAGAGESHLRLGVVTDDGRVDVGEAVDLGAAEEPDVDAARLQPVVEHLRHADHAVGGVGQLAVADRQRQALRLGAERARLVHEHEVRGVGAAGQVGRRRGQADADEAHLAVVQAAGGGDGHRVVGRELGAHEGTTVRLKTCPPKT